MYNRQGSYRSSKDGGARVSKAFSAKWDSGMSKVCHKCNQGWSKGDMLMYENDKLIHETCPNGKKGKKGNPLKMLKSHNYPVAVEGESIAIPEIIQNKVFVPSVHQQAAIDWVRNGKGHGVMRAVAGSGKTTTLLHMLEILPSTMRVLYMSFNRTIVKTARAKAKAMGLTNVDIFTINSKGFAIDRKYPGFKDMNEFKVMDILTDMGYFISKEKVKDPVLRNRNHVLRRAVKKIVDLVKNTLADYNDPRNIEEIIEKFHIEIDEEMQDEIIRIIPEVMEINNENLEYVDFNDQCYLPIVNPFFAKRFDLYDFILCDEFQDFNRCNVEFAIRSLAPDGRILAVGDHHQSINGFRGADIHAIPSATQRLQASVLPLSVSFRCPRSHVGYVQQWVPEIESAPNAIEGTIGEMKYSEMVAMAEEGNAIICRTNAPLVKPAFELIRQGRKAIIRGKEIGKDLVDFIERFQTDDLGLLDTLMQQYTEKEIERWTSKNNEMMAELALEKYQTIAEVAQVSMTVAELVTKIQTLFSDDNKGIVLSSIHKFKGLEAQRVFWYRRDLCPHPKAKTEDELEQEVHMMYVAGTRSLDELYFVSSWEEG